MLGRCLDRVTASLHAQLPELGRNIAIDDSDMPAYANGQRFVSKAGRERAPEEYADPVASWGHRSAVSTRKGGGFYGYKIAWPSAPRPIFRARGTSVPLATASRLALPLLDAVKARGFAADTCAIDKGYDFGPIHDGVRGTRLPTDHPAPSDARRGPWRSQAADVRARRVAVRRVGLQARREQVALRDRVRLPADLTILAKLACALSRARAVPIAA